MSGDLSTTMRSRRVAYDEYTGAFYVETRVESLTRQEATREKLTSVLNRSADTALDFNRRRLETEHEVFTRRQEHESDMHKESLRDYIAHKHVLEDILRMRRSFGPDQSSFGTYGPGTSKLALQDRIERRMKECSLIERRRREAKRLLDMRRPLSEYNRNLSTSAIFRRHQEKKENARKRLLEAQQTDDVDDDSDLDSSEEDATPPKQASPRRETRPERKLVLPPITVKMARPTSKIERESPVPGARPSTSTQTPLPAVFIT